MIPFFITWATFGLAYWFKHQIQFGSRMGFIGDVIVALPMCLIFGPIPFLQDLMEK